MTGLIILYGANEKGNLTWSGFTKKSWYWLSPNPISGPEELLLNPLWDPLTNPAPVTMAE